MIKIWEWLQGKKTYIVLILSFVDAGGIAVGWWSEGTFRHVVELLGFGAAIRSGIQASGPAAPVVKSIGLLLLGGVALLGLTACATYHDAGDGRYNVTRTTEEPSLFGTNMGFARVENCARKNPEYYPAQFTECNPVTGWIPMYSQGQGGQVLGGALTGLGFGLGSAFGGGGSSASANSSVVAPNGGGHH